MPAFVGVFAELFPTKGVRCEVDMLLEIATISSLEFLQRKTGAECFHDAVVKHPRVYEPTISTHVSMSFRKSFQKLSPD